MTEPTHVTRDGRRIVVAGAVERGGRLLAARRTRPVSVAGGWELPGGKVEPGEDPAAALVRELREELAIDTVVVGRVPGPRDGDWPIDDDQVLRVLRVRVARGDPAPGIAHDEVRWLEPDEADAVAWLGPDVAPAAEALRRLDTWVGFPVGDLHGRGTVLLTRPLDADRLAVVVDRTPFHPVDPSWPDQPGDVGVLSAGGRRTDVLETVTGAVTDDGELLVDDAIGRRRGDPAVTWVVVHVVSRSDASPDLLGATIGLDVDGAARTLLSRAHSGCHLSALALNEASARFWSKEPPRRDSRGFPFLDQIAITVSRLTPLRSYDAYRCGRSLRKSGFDSDAFLAERDQVAADANALLEAWVASDAPSRVETDGDPTLPARRRWWCALPGGPAVVSCGGTHVPRLGELGGVRVVYEPTDDGFAAWTSVGDARHAVTDDPVRP